MKSCQLRGDVRQETAEVQPWNEVWQWRALGEPRLVELPG